jgi:hypothetical protein
MEDPKIEIKGLKDKLGVTDEQLDNLRDLRVRTEMHQATMMINVWSRGGNIHGVNKSETTKRRKANKLARKQRKQNG